MARLRAEPGVRRSRFSSFVPGFAGGAGLEFDDRVPVTAPPPLDVSRLDVAADMLDVYGAELLAGRRFAAGDVGAANAVIVNETFARWFAGTATRWARGSAILERAGQAMRRRLVRDRRRRARFPARS